MSQTNQVCVCCEARDNCPHYDTRRTVCMPVNFADFDDFSIIQDTTDWQHYRVQAAIAAMQGMLANPAHHKTQVESGVPCSYFYAVNAVMCADDLIKELQKKGGEE